MTPRARELGSTALSDAAGRYLVCPPIPSTGTDTLLPRRSESGARSSSDARSVVRLAYRGGLLAAQGLLEEAIAIDSNFAMAYRRPAVQPTNLGRKRLDSSDLGGVNNLPCSRSRSGPGEAERL